MKFYLDITLLPDSEINIGFLWHKVYGQTHRALVEKKNANGNSDIAVSFPTYDDTVFPLGNKLRLLASTEKQLEQLGIDKYLKNLTDYCHCTSIKEVPQSVNIFVRFKRVQFDTNIERLVRRRAKRKNESFEQAFEHLNGFKDKDSKLPFVNMNSLSSNHRFRLFIQKEEAEREKLGDFTCYGLSKTATVPWF